jgi:histidinol dehydrogenase
MYLTRNVEPVGAELDALLLRAGIDRDAVRETVRGVLEQVRKEGDQALFALEKQFDKADLATLRVREAEMKEADGLVPDDLKKAILHAASNIRAFHQAEVPQGEHLIVQEGVELSRKIVPIQTVGLYIPGGTAPLFSTVLMLSIPAQVAGCPRIVLATPPGPDGKVNPAILFAASVGGVHEVYKLGGSQAIAALAFGTASVPKVDKIFGPGNRFVMEAKLQVSSEICAIDMPAGPSEVMVIADEKSNPAFVASDLLSQAEHGPDSQAMLLVISPTDGSVFLDAVESAMDAELSQLPRKRFLLSSLSHSHAIVVHTEGAALSDRQPVRSGAFDHQHGQAERTALRRGERRFGVPRSVLLRERRRLCQRHQPHPADQRLGAQHQRRQRGFVCQEDHRTGTFPYRAGRAFPNHPDDGPWGAIGSPPDGRSGADGGEGMRELLRANIASLVPYRCARDEFTGTASVYLDANENWQDFVAEKGRNRYPDPLCVNLRHRIDEVMGLPFAHTVVGNGSDEIIDNLIRMFCVPGKDRILLMPPTYGAYRVFADINDVKSDVVPLNENFGIDFPALEAYLAQEKRDRGNGRCKLLFICSPNNPTGNAFPLEQIEQISSRFDGITVVDEAYFDFNRYPSAVTLLDRHPNLVVLRTLSKSWGLAGARVGILVASEDICQVMRSMKYPYNVSSPAQETALHDLDHADAVREGTKEILAERERLKEGASHHRVCETGLSDGRQLLFGEGYGCRRHLSVSDGKRDHRPQPDA